MTSEFYFVGDRYIVLSVYLWLQLVCDVYATSVMSSVGMWHLCNVIYVFSWYMTFMQPLINVAATSWHCIGTDSMFHLCCVPAGFCLVSYAGVEGESKYYFQSCEELNWIIAIFFRFCFTAHSDLLRRIRTKTWALGLNIFASWINIQRITERTNMGSEMQHKY